MKANCHSLTLLCRLRKEVIFISLRERYIINLLNINCLFYLEFAYVKNQQMKMLNIAMNPFPDSDVEQLERLLDRLPEDF